MYINEMPSYMGEKVAVNISLDKHRPDVRNFLSSNKIAFIKESDSLSKYSINCVETIAVYFNTLLDAIRQDNQELIAHFAENAKEGSYINLGYKKKLKSYGKGMGKQTFMQLANSIKSSPAFKSGRINDISDTYLFIPGIGIDVVSDLIANLIYPELSKFTMDVLKEVDSNGISLYSTSTISTIRIKSFNINTKLWEDFNLEVMNFESRNYLLTPMSFCIDEHEFNTELRKYHDKELFPLIKKEMLKNNIVSVDEINRVSKADARDYILGRIRKGNNNYLRSSTTSKYEILEIIAYMYEKNKKNTLAN
ncbi:Uncharacterised protein [Erysipelothrix amsterdamensis]|uniref:Uncharacterized protein n=2 Tax=Erysipelothrix TaxID=1647 RepID=A0AAU9VI81_9FIRM|nr:hypothetical protein [Erysipelothrix rhusiopathiae]CAH2760872.1 Uncharacterised protein [Erysipelothrix sp. A18Y020d]AMS11870.1 hypothetical protein A2I91_09045 [Erysipelothrix rhusiopathiae]AOO68371.1 hypothetical protein BC346_08565 [Erysipelothrix rhusiopathiae]AWU40781.1 hypothetical protein DM789_00545 [Erysipelothrix rhusiopathiae]MCG4437300.1 hypothetical protein [Erysipelothrix rhusiopathiae]